MAKSMTLKQFQARFPTDDACLNHLFKTRYGHEIICPKCGQIDTFHKLCENASVYMQLRASHSPDGWNAFPVNTHPAHHLVSGDVPIHVITQRRFGKGSAEAYWRDLQDGVAHVQ